MDSTKSNEGEKDGKASSPLSKSSSASNSSKTDAQAKTPPKRTQRQRNPVVLLQHSYYAMYDDKNNRAGKPNKRKKSSSKQDLSPQQEASKQGNPSASNNPKKRKNSISASDKKSSKASSSLPQATASSKTSVKSKSVYRWVGPPISKPQTTSSEAGAGTAKGKEQSKKKFYQKVELNVGDHPALVKVGDFVLVSSADYEEDQLHDKAPEGGKNPLNQSPVVNTESRSAAVRSMMNSEGDDDDEDDVLNATLEAEDKMDIAMNSLDPYVGRVEEMWEEPRGSQQEQKGRSYGRMKYRVRWFFKKSDVVSIRGQFVGVSRSELVSAMTPRDILLGEQTDINEISTILGKCKVIRIKPDPAAGRKRSSSRISKSQGAFFCRYNISIVPPPKSKGKGKIVITPYEGPDEEENEEDVQKHPNKKPRMDTKRSSQQSDDVQAKEQERTTAEEATTENHAASKNGNSSSAEEKDDDSSQGMSDRRTRKKAPVTEGSATLKIKVGEEHQASLPPQMNKRKYLPTRKPTMVWKPQGINDTKLHSYFNEASAILKAHMKEKGYDMTRSLPHNIPSEFSANDSKARLASHCAYREFNVDDLIFLLHDHNYNTASALKGLKNYPEEYLFIWTKEDKALYNAGFQNHSSNLHLISKNVAISNKHKGVHKDVVDYHYRFKIPDQFKRFQDLKREQARRMLEAGERLRLNEFLSEGGYQNGHASSTTGGPKKNQQWSKNGGVPGEIGELEARRLGCKSFLFEVREAVGPEKYLTLVNLLKSLHARVLTIPQLKEGFAAILENHPKLMSQFDAYLPTSFR